MFCPKCGKEIEENTPNVKGFHVECYLGDHPAAQFPEKFEVERCPMCRKVRWRGLWQPLKVEMLEALIKSKTIAYLANPVFEFEWGDLEEKACEARITLKGSMESQSITLDGRTTIKFIGNQCDMCMKARSNYWEALVQIRYEGKPSKAEVERRVEQVRALIKDLNQRDPMAFIMEYKQTRNGLDFFMGGLKSSKQVVKALEKDSKEKVASGYTYHGMDEHGRPGKRHSFCIRL